MNLPVAVANGRPPTARRSVVEGRRASVPVVRLALSIGRKLRSGDIVAVRNPMARGLATWLGVRNQMYTR